MVLLLLLWCLWRWSLYFTLGSWKTIEATWIVVFTPNLAETCIRWSLPSCIDLGQCRNIGSVVQVMNRRTRECTTNSFMLYMPKFKSFSGLSLCKCASLSVILETSIWKCLKYAFPGNVVQEETWCRCWKRQVRVTYFWSCKCEDVSRVSEQSTSAFITFPDND